MGVQGRHARGDGPRHLRSLPIVVPPVAKPDGVDIQLLEHEQIHFDIAVMGGGQEDPGELPDVYQRVRRSGRDRADSANHRARRSRFQEEQERFDRETAHGVNGRVQAQWKRRIDDQLKW